MAQIKNLHLLTDIEPGDLDKMEQAAVLHKRHANISFKIIEIEGKSVTIQIVQEKNSTGIYQPQKRLIEIVHETYDRFFPGMKIKVHAVPFVESPANIVTASWVNKNMTELGIKLKTIATDTGLDYANLSSYMGGEKPMPQMIKAMFYYYFLSKRG